MVLGGVVGASTKYQGAADPASLTGLKFLWNDLLVAAQPSAGWLVPSTAGVTAIAHGCRKLIGAPWLWEVVNNSLNTFRHELFDHHPRGPDHLHRVTLFRYRRFAIRCWCWPWSGWLIPVARSGYSTRNTWTTFRAPSEPSKAKGIAGKAFGHKGMLFVPAAGEKELPRVVEGTKDKAIDEYARRTHTDPGWVRARLKKRPEPLPMSFVGIPIDVKGRRWGVIVIDSADPRFKEESVEEKFRLIGGTLSSLLQGVW